MTKKKLRWYPQQSQRFICTIFSQPSPEPCWTWCGSAPKPPGTFSGTFSGTLLNLTWLCTKASQTFSPEPCWTWPGSEPKPPTICPEPVEPDLALHQSLPEPSPEPSWEPFWTWPGFAPKPPRPSLERCWTYTKASQTFSGTLLNLTWLCTKASQTFNGTFSGTLLNLTWLCTKASRIPLWNLCGTLLNLIRNLFGTSLNLTRRPHQCTPELFWAKDPISLRCWGMTGTINLPNVTTIPFMLV